MQMLADPNLFQKWLRQFFERAFQEAQQSSSKKLEQVSEAVFQKLQADFRRAAHQMSEGAQKMYDDVAALAKQASNGSPIKIEVSAADIRAAQREVAPKLIQGIASFKLPYSFSTLSVDCFVTCGHWHLIGELKQSTINLIDYLDKLLPPADRTASQKTIGLVTFQNGIRNTLNDFGDMSQSIVNQFPEGPLCIGLYNPTTNSLFQDMSRFRAEPRCNEQAVFSLCQMIKTLAERVPQINPNLIWTHFAHSEAGLIAHAVLDLCQQRWKKETERFLKNHLIIATYGPVKPVPIDFVLDAINTYSNQDIALLFGKKYLDTSLDQITDDVYTSMKVHQGKTYKVTIVASQAPIQPILNLPIPTPEVLTVEERLELSWFERLVALPDIEQSPRLGYAISQLITNTVNHIDHSITDHGFIADTYQAALKDNIDNIKEKFQIYEAKSVR